MIDQDIEFVNDIPPTINFYLSDTTRMHNVVLAKFYGKLLMQFYSGTVERMGRTRAGYNSTYGSSSRWNTLGSHKMLFIVGLAMCPMFIDAKVLPSPDLTRVRVQNVNRTELERVRGSAVLQHGADWDLPIYNETRNQEQQ